MPIREGCRLFKQQLRRMLPKVTFKVKDAIERLLKVGFIRTARYVEWLSNVVLVVKKKGKLRVRIKFRNLNLATPKDKYPMPSSQPTSRCYGQTPDFVIHGWALRV